MLERNAERLLAVPGVVGHGIGERDGTPCIRVYVTAAEVAGRLPETIDVYPVEAVVTGRVTARSPG